MRGRESSEAEAAAIRAAHGFVDAFSARDDVAQRANMNFPHVRIASGRVIVWEKPEDFATPFDRLARTEGWARSTLDAAEPIHSSGEKVHLAVEFTRYDANDRPYVTHRALWVVTNVHGHWGLQARSSFAP